MKGRNTAHTLALSFRVANLFLPLRTVTPGARQRMWNSSDKLLNSSRCHPPAPSLWSRPPLSGCGPPTLSFPFCRLFGKWPNLKASSPRAGVVTVKTPQLRRQSPKIAPNLHPSMQWYPCSIWCYLCKMGCYQSEMMLSPYSVEILDSNS